MSDPPIPGGSKLDSLDEAVAGVVDGSTVMVDDATVTAVDSAP